MQRSDDTEEVIRTQLTELPQPIRAFAPQVSKRTERIVQRMIQKRRQDRYPTAVALLKDFKEASRHV